MNEIALSQSFSLETCCTCGVAFAVPTPFQSKCLENGRSFYCPNGHSQSYTVTEVQRLKHALAEEQGLRQQSLNREANLVALLRSSQIAKKRLANRLNAGVCPVPGCKRHFTNLQRHITTKHGGVALPEAAQLKAIEGGVNHERPKGLNV